jgi:hypothetical protein
MNPRGVQLFTCGWLPASPSPKALVFLCHGKCRSISFSSCSSDHHHKFNAFSTLKNLLVLAKVKNPLVKALVLSIEFAIYKYYPY